MQNHRQLEERPPLAAVLCHELELGCPHRCERTFAMSCCVRTDHRV